LRGTTEGGHYHSASRMIMSEEPENLVLQLLRGIRDDVAEVNA
jgi:hypothetical protein